MRITKATIVTYDAVTHTATVRTVGSIPYHLDAVRVATNIPAAAAIAGRECSVLHLDDNNPADAIVLSVQGALPPPGGAGPYISDADSDTYVHTEQTPDEDQIHFSVQGVERLLLATTSPHVTIPDGSEVYMADNVAIGADVPDTNIQLSVRRDPPGAGGCALRADLQAGTGAGSGRRTAILGTANSGDTFALTAVQGLDFIAQTTELTGSLLDLTAVRLRWGGVFNTVAPTRGSGLMVDTPTLMGGTPPTTVYGAWIKNQGDAAITTLYGLKIDDQTLATNRYLIEAGPATPNLRLAAGAPAANTQLWLAINNGTVALRQVEIGAANSGGTAYRMLRVLN